MLFDCCAHILDFMVAYSCVVIVLHVCERIWWLMRVLLFEMSCSMLLMLLSVSFLRVACSMSYELMSCISGLF